MSATGSVLPAGGDERAARYREVRRVTLVGSAVDLVLGVVKLLVGFAASSQALIADGIHSLSDLATDALVLLAAKHAHTEADEEHPYGHGRFETAATVALGVSLLAIAAGIAYDGFHRLLHPERLRVPEWYALLAAGASVLAKEAIYHYTIRAARRVRSNMLKANAWHSRSDALSSVAVIVGVSGALLGYAFVDTIAAIVVALMVARIGWRLAASSVEELVDKGVDPEQLENLKSIILSVPGVEELHLLRTRTLAGRTFADVHIILDDPRVSVSEGHQISETVRARLIRSVDDVVDVTVHIDPEDDEIHPPNRMLPLRDKVQEALDSRWRGLADGPEIREIRLHYLSGRIEVEVVLPLELAPGGEAGSDPHGFEAAIADLDYVTSVHTLYE